MIQTIAIFLMVISHVTREIAFSNATQNDISQDSKNEAIYELHTSCKFLY